MRIGDALAATGPHESGDGFGSGSVDECGSRRMWRMRVGDALPADGPYGSKHWYGDGCGDRSGHRCGEWESWVMSYQPHGSGDGSREWDN